LRSVLHTQSDNFRGARQSTPVAEALLKLAYWVSGTVLNLEQLMHRNVQRFRGGLVFKAHRLWYHSTLGVRVTKKKQEVCGTSSSALKKKDPVSPNLSANICNSSTWFQSKLPHVHFDMSNEDWFV